MALEVRSLPPGAAFALALALVPAAPLPTLAQQTQALREDPDAVEAKARLLRELESQIEQRRVEIAQEEQGLEAMRRSLEAAKQEILEEKAQLEALREQVQADAARREKLVDERLQRISRVYAAMKPREAAQALEGMEDAMAVAILERLQGRVVGKIFDLMPKDRVRELTRRLEAGRSPARE